MREERVEPCLLSRYRTNVLLVRVEGFPHSGFRHFIRYINIRGVTPEEQGEERRGRADKRVLGLLGLREGSQLVFTWLHGDHIQQTRQVFI